MQLPLTWKGVLTVIQVLSRYWALWGIVEQAPVATSTGALTLLKAGPVTLQLNMITLLFCWSVTEVLRYGFYAVKVKIPSIYTSAPVAKAAKRLLGA